MGDSFHDPNSEQKWAEFNTAPEVNAKVAKVDLSKENQLWFYLGKTSTEARPQYTEDLAKPRHNVKSNFLDTVKPPPVPWPAFGARPYQGMHTMPLKPMPMPYPGKPPAQIQPNIRPYQYKPKPDPVPAVPAPSQAFKYPPDARKYANSMVGHQPNVVYDPRPLANKAPQHGNQSQAQGQAPSGPYHHHRLAPQAQTFHHYAPPPQSTKNSWTAPPPTASGSMLKGIDRYASRSPPLPPNPFQYQAPPADQGQHQYPQFPYGQSTPQAYTPPAAPPSSGAPPPPSSPQRSASLSHILAKPAAGSRKPPPMYANSPPTSSQPSRPSQSEYLAYVTKYPYLKNAFLRRAKTYISPYSADGGFTPEWRPKASPQGFTQATNGIAPRPPITAFKPSSQHQPHTSQPDQPASRSAPGSVPPNTFHHYSGPPPPASAPAGAPHSLPPPPRQMPALNFMSEKDFQRDMLLAKTQPPTSVSMSAQMPKWDSMMRQINSASNSTSSTPAPQHSVGPPSGPGSGRATPHLPPPLPPQHRAGYTPPQPQGPGQQQYAPQAPTGYGTGSMPGQTHAPPGPPPRRESGHGGASVGLPSGTPPIREEVKTYHAPPPGVSPAGPSPPMGHVPALTPPPQKKPEPWKFQYFSVPGNSVAPPLAPAAPKVVKTAKAGAAKAEKAE